MGNKFKITLSDETTDLLFGECCYRQQKQIPGWTKSKILEELIFRNLKHSVKFDIKKISE